MSIYLFGKWFAIARHNVNSNKIFLGTAGIIMAAPSHYDARQPIDVKYSKIDQKTTMRKTQLDED